MNLLAHAYLSFGNPGILAGNMISDYVKGRKKLDYPGIVQKGITLHREIDSFTDAHPATKAAAVFFKPYYRLYAPAFIDVVYDHFLANDPENFPDSHTLAVFASETYRMLGQYEPVFPPVFRQMFHYM